MSRIRSQCLDADHSDPSEPADVFLRQEPDEEEEEEEEEENEGNGKDDDGDDEEEGDEGYSVRS